MFTSAWLRRFAGDPQVVGTAMDARRAMRSLLFGVPAGMTGLRYPE